MTKMKIDELNVNIFESRKELGQYAADTVAVKIKELLQSKPYINMIFAAAPSQNEFLDALIAQDIAWEKINAFHMDEYVGLEADAPQGFGNFLRERIFNRVPFQSVHFLNGNAKDLEEECVRYEGLLKDFPTDIVCLGIGENTHIAFNDPHVADFNDQKMVKVVDLDEACRQQQVNDGCFKEISEVPEYALTLTVPALFKSNYAYCIVPGEKKAAAIYHTLTEPIASNYPSTILRQHNHAILFIDKDSSSQIQDIKASDHE
jgi:glucosamine-6-phosphate deaminase